MRKYFLSLFLFFIISPSLFCQDSIKIFTQQDLFWFIDNYHPTGKLASLQIQLGKNELRKSRGQLDPNLFVEFDNKFFKQQEYYNLFSGGLKVPTWFGVDFQAGIDRNFGTNINPESQLPANGLFFAGLTVPLGQGLFIDKRRAEIRKAQLYEQSTYQEQKLIVNNLYFEASVAYIDWMSYYNQVKLFENALKLAQERFEGVKQSFLFGDVPAIDTLEAFIVVQTRNVSYNQSLLDYKNATLNLSNYLWFENNTPLEITETMAPPLFEQLTDYNFINLDSLNVFVSNINDLHPELLLYNFKLKQLDIERRYFADQLKPIINLKYNLINEPLNNEVVNSLSRNNYTFGVNFSFPLFLRSSRSRLNISKINIQETSFELKVKSLELTNKIKSYYNQTIALKQQIDQFKSATQNYFLLLEAEKQKFFAGESSVFLINSRESAYIQAAIKLIELNVKYQSSIAEFKQLCVSWK